MSWTLVRWVMSLVLAVIGSIFYWMSYDCEVCWWVFICCMALAGVLIIVPSIVGEIQDRRRWNKNWRDDV